MKRDKNFKHGYFLYLAQYQGIGFLSRGIKLFTRSKWSHSAVVLRNTYTDYFLQVEAWGTNGVIKTETSSLVTCLSAHHHSNTTVDIFSIEVTRDEYAKVRKFLLNQVGKKYDFGLILKFLTRKPAMLNGKWICSELVEEAFMLVGKPLQRMESWKMAPEHCGISTVVEPLFAIKTI